jgi:hypothetical protein
VPRLSRFYGIVAMYYDDHAPPHFHARYAEHEATIQIETLDYLEGKLPRRVYNLVLEWAVQHREELRMNWIRARDGQPLQAIEPLETKELSWSELKRSRR